MNQCRNGHDKTPENWVVQKNGRKIWYCRRCKAEASARHRANASEAYKERQRAAGRRYQASLLVRRRAAAIEAYGGICVWCGESIPEFLTLDHVHSNGAEHRREIGQGAMRLLKWAEDHGYPNTLRLLCYNCNCASAHHGDEKILERLREQQQSRRSQGNPS